jgi:hypothetical protein
MNRCSVRLLGSTTESNSESAEVCRTLRGKNNTESPYMMEDRSTGGLALPAVSPATDREQPAQILTGRLFGGAVKPEISNAQDSSGFSRRRMSMGEVSTGPSNCSIETLGGAERAC